MKKVFGKGKPIATEKEWDEVFEQKFQNRI